MILLFSIICAVAYLGLTLFQALYVWLYSKRMNQTPRLGGQHCFDGHVSVVLCLRGSDPSLSACLNGLAQQSHHDFQLYCVVDDETDPALAEVQKFAGQFRVPPQVLAIEQPGSSRSLKCSALLTAFDAITRNDTNSEVIALIDADTSCDSDWLQDLVTPLSDPEIDATSGNRWFEPADDALGSWVRQIWNAAAVVQMALYGIPWGGSLAFRRSLLQETDFRDRLERAFCEDTLLSDVLLKEGRTFYTSTQLVVTNEESTTLPATSSFIHRQLLTTRLYHWSWFWVLLHGISIFLINTATVIGLVMAIAMTAWLPAILFLSSLVVSQLANMALLGWIGRINRRKMEVRRGHEKLISPAGRSQLGYLLAVLASPWVHSWATLCTLFRSRVHWRGIDYRVHSGQVEMLEYRKFSARPSINQSIE
ncbi:MAG: glycosyltransferase family 2 protein [Mariniblastus sp.]|nr:glycosyltransferase family 2 protein [Mariniblastus sp.]